MQSNGTDFHAKPSPTQSNSKWKLRNSSMQPVLWWAFKNSQITYSGWKIYAFQFFQSLFHSERCKNTKWNILELSIFTKTSNCFNELFSIGMRVFFRLPRSCMKAQNSSKSATAVEAVLKLLWSAKLRWRRRAVLRWDFTFNELIPIRTCRWRPWPHR